MSRNKTPSGKFRAWPWKEREKIEEVILYIQRKSVFAFCISWALPYLFNTVTNPLLVSSICIRHLKVRVFKLAVTSICYDNSRKVYIYIQHVTFNIYHKEEGVRRGK
jgi:hypothetical protein